MKAVVLKKYDTPFVLEEVEKPVAAPGQVLVAVKASAVNPLDLKIKGNDGRTGRDLTSFSIHWVERT
jgi:NADPH:quinone reductase-like Zn-dependent oxidoreductase